MYQQIRDLTEDHDFTRRIFSYKLWRDVREDVGQTVELSLNFQMFTMLVQINC